MTAYYDKKEIKIRGRIRGRIRGTPPVF